MDIMKTALALLVLALALVQARRPVNKPEPKALTHARDEYFQSKHKRGTYWIKPGRPSADCTFKGYAPNGPVTSVGDITAPKATLDAKKGIMGVLDGPTKKMGQAAAVAMHAIKFSASIMKNFPALAPALGVFSALRGMLGSKEPSPQDILDKVNEAIADLTNEVNKKLKEMENYVDASIAKAEKDLVTAEYQSAFRLWASCLKEPTEVAGNRCQRDSLRHIVAIRPKFTPASNLLQKTSFTMKEVRRWEAYMLAFRDYANLVVMQLTTLSQYYCLERPTASQGAHYCQQYADQLITEATFYIKYAQGAIAAIKKGHWGKASRGPCIDSISIKCKDIIEGKSWISSGAHTANSCTSTCVILDASKKKYCGVTYTTRVDGKSKSSPYQRKYYPYIRGDKNFMAAQKYYGEKKLNDIAKDYQVKNHAVMDKYWNQEVLDFVPSWTKAIQLAKDMKKKNPKTSDAKPVLDEGFSPQYRTRLVNAGYHFMEEQKRDGTSEVVPVENNKMEDEEENSQVFKISCDEGGDCRFDEPEVKEEEEEDAPEESNVDEFHSYSSITDI